MRRSPLSFGVSYFCCFYEILTALALLPQLWMFYKDCFKKEVGIWRGAGEARTRNKREKQRDTWQMFRICFDFYSSRKQGQRKEEECEAGRGSGFIESRGGEGSEEMG